VILLRTLLPEGHNLRVFLFTVREIILNTIRPFARERNVRWVNPVTAHGSMIAFRSDKQSINKNFTQAADRFYLFTGMEQPALAITIYCGSGTETGNTLRSKKYGSSLLTNFLHEQKPDYNTRIRQTDQDCVN
jgi:hypothetical protein